MAWTTGWLFARIGDFASMDRRTLIGLGIAAIGGRAFAQDNTSFHDSYNGTSELPAPGPAPTYPAAQPAEAHVHALIAGIERDPAAFALHVG